MTDEVVNIYSMGFVCCSVCAPKDMTRKQIEKEVNRQSPSGIKPWKISKDKTFSGGEPMPCVCDNDPDRKHWLLNC